MARRLVVSLLCASALVAVHADESQPPVLAQEQLSQPDTVVDWLKSNDMQADKKTAKMAYDHGQKSKQRGSWSAAAKAFGDSAIHYPSPAALREYADNGLRVYGAVRHRDKTYRENCQRDLGEAEAIYRTALAADTVLKLLSEHERRQIQANADCLADYIKSSESSGACPPLQLYGMPAR